MQIMNRCPVGDCYNLKPVEAHDCGKHDEPVKKLCACGCGRNAGGKDRYASTCRRAIIGTAPEPSPVKLCRTCGEKEPRKGQADCNSCQNKRARPPKKDVEIVPWTPKPRPKSLMTDAAQRKLDKALHDRLAEKCGYRSGEPRKLSPAEIAAIAGEITHVSRIPNYTIRPYAVAASR